MEYIEESCMGLYRSNVQKEHHMFAPEYLISLHVERWSNREGIKLGNRASLMQEANNEDWQGNCLVGVCCS